MDTTPRFARKDPEVFQDTPVMLLQAAFRKPAKEALPIARQIILKWAEEQHGELPEGALEGKAFDLDRPGEDRKSVV
jgi:hypothetical protein